MCTTPVSVRIAVGGLYGSQGVWGLCPVNLPMLRESSNCSANRFLPLNPVDTTDAACHADTRGTRCTGMCGFSRLFGVVEVTGIQSLLCRRLGVEAMD